MADEQLPYLLGYPASFCVTPDEARGNILRMIEAEIPGWDGGAGRWAQRLRDQLSRPNRTRKLNRFGAKFSAVEWVWVMRALLMECERRLLVAGGGEGDRALLEPAGARREAAPDVVSLRDPGPDGSPHGSAGLLFPHRASA